MTKRTLLFFFLSLSLLGSWSCGSNNSAPSAPKTVSTLPYFAASDSTGGLPSSGEVDLSFTAGSFVPLSNGWVLLGDRTDNQILLYDAITASAGQTYQLSAPPNEMAYDAARTLLYAGLDNTDAVAQINVATGAVTQMALSFPVSTLALDPNGNLFCEAYVGGTNNNDPVELIQEGDGAPLTTYSNLPESFMAYDGPASLLLQVSGTVSSYSFTETTNNLSLAQTLSLGCGSVNCGEIAVSPDGNHAAIYGSQANNNEIIDFDPTNLNITYGEWPGGSFGSSCQAQNENFSPNSQYFVTVTGMVPDLVVYSVATHALMKSLVMTTFDLTPNRSGFSRGGGIVYSLGAFNGVTGHVILDWALFP